MVKSKEKKSLILMEGDVIEIATGFNAFGQKSYTVVSVDADKIRCRVDKKNLLGHTEITVFKDELSDKMIEKFAHRGKIQSRQDA